MEKQAHGFQHRLQLLRASLLQITSRRSPAFDVHRTEAPATRLLHLVSLSHGFNNDSLGTFASWTTLHVVRYFAVFSNIRVQAARTVSYLFDTNMASHRPTSLCMFPAPSAISSPAIYRLPTQGIIERAPPFAGQRQGSPPIHKGTQHQPGEETSDRGLRPFTKARDNARDLLHSSSTTSTQHQPGLVSAQHATRGALDVCRPALRRQGEM